LVCLYFHFHSYRLVYMIAPTIMQTFNHQAIDQIYFCRYLVIWIISKKYVLDKICYSIKFISL